MEHSSLEHDTVDALRALGAASGVDLFGPMAERFLTDAPSRLDRIEEAAGRQDAAEAEATAHGLRGLAATLGARRFAELARRLEEEARSEAERQRLVGAMRVELESVRRALAPDPERPARVVVADDEPHVARLVAFVLARAGYHVTVVGDGLEALEAVARVRPDALVLDLVMPHVGGLEVLARLAASGTPAPVTLVLTARATADATGEILAAGAAAHCLKPIAPTTLLRRLADAGVPPRVARRDGDGIPPGASLAVEPEESAALEERSADWEALEALYDVAASGRDAQQSGVVPRLLKRLAAVRPGTTATLWRRDGDALVAVASLPDESGTAVSATRPAVVEALALGRPVAGRGHLVLPLPAADGLAGALEVRHEAADAPFDAPFARLAESIAAQAALLLENEALHRADAERERLEREVAIAARIQQTLLAADASARVPGLEIATLAAPSRTVDGDFHDVVRRGERVVDVFVGDVMGKGVPAALLGAAAKTQLLRALADPAGAGPGDVVRAAHDALYPRLVELESFVTLAYARFDAGQGLVRLVDCGHARMLLRRRSGTCGAVEGDSLPLGFRADATFAARELAVGPGDVCLLYSDGVTEAADPAGELFGEERLRRWLQRQEDLRPSALVAALRAEVAAFTGRETPTDDLTCVAVRLALEETCPPS